MHLETSTGQQSDAVGAAKSACDWSELHSAIRLFPLFPLLIATVKQTIFILIQVFFL